MGHALRRVRTRMGNGYRQCPNAARAGALDAPTPRPHITGQIVDRGTDAVRNLKHTLMAAGVILLVAWAVLLVMHILFALVWVFFWVGLVGILVAMVLHAVERLV